MKVLLFVFVQCLLVCYGVMANASLSTSEAFKHEGIDKDMIQVVPNDQLKIQYGDKSVQLGNQFKLSEVKEAPKLEWTADNNTLYTLIKGWF